jgi:cytoskeleton protein RodZ
LGYFLLESNLKRVIEHIGAELGAKRMEAGLSIKDVAEKLHIQHNYLDAIERLDKDALPTLGYALGFVRTYARFLGLNEKSAIERFKVDIEAPIYLSAPVEPSFIPKSSFHMPKGSFAIGVVLSCAFVVVSWYGMKADAISAVPASATIQPTESWDFAPVEPTHDNANTISLKAVGPSWVQVKDGLGNILISRIMLKGEIFETERKNLPVLSLRDAGAIELYLGGERIGAIGQKGAPGENIPLAEVSRY